MAPIVVPTRDELAALATKIWRHKVFGRPVPAELFYRHKNGTAYYELQQRYIEEKRREAVKMRNAIEAAPTPEIRERVAQRGRAALADVAARKRAEFDGKPPLPRKTFPPGYFGLNGIQHREAMARRNDFR